MSDRANDSHCACLPVSVCVCLVQMSRRGWRQSAEIKVKSLNCGGGSSEHGTCIHRKRRTWLEWVHQSNGDADALLLLLLQFCHQWDQRRTGRSSVHACKERERERERERVEECSGSEALAHFGNTLTATDALITHWNSQRAHTPSWHCKDAAKNKASWLRSRKEKDFAGWEADNWQASARPKNCRLPKRPAVAATHTWAHFNGCTS